jgi:Ca2+-binding EF-hand superfamily protein
LRLFFLNKIKFEFEFKGDLKRKLEYAFQIYDDDGNGYLDKDEIKNVINGMLDLLGADKKMNDSQKLADEAIKALDTSKDGKVTKDEFIEGLMKNYSLRSLMNPFS